MWWQAVAYLEISVCCTVQSKETLLTQKQLITKVSNVKRLEWYTVISLVLAFACVCCDCVMYLLLRNAVVHIAGDKLSVVPS